MSGFKNEVAKELTQQPGSSIRYLVGQFFASPESSILKGFVVIAIRYTPTGIPSYTISRSVLNVVESPSGLTNIGN